MKQTHTRRDKGRAVFLAALMVLSVFAMSASFAGAAAASTHDDISAAATVDAAVADGSDEVEFEVQLTDADGEPVSEEGVEITVDDVQNENGDTLNDLSAGDTAETDEDGVATFSATAGAEGEYTVQFSDDDGNTASAAVTFVESLVTDDAIDLEDGQLVWQGQSLVNGDFAADSDVELREDDENGDLIRQLTVNDEGDVSLSSDNLQGDYALVGEDENEDPVIINFEVAVENLSAEWSPESTQDTSTLEINSDRGTYSVNIESDDLNQDEIRQIFDDNDVTILNTENGIQVYQSGDVDLEGDFSDVDAGEYEFTVTSADTGVEDTATITVPEEGAPTAQFDQSTYSEEAGDIVEFTVEMENTDEAEVDLSEQDDNYDVTLEVTDEDDDGEVTVYFDTYQAGDDDDAAFYTAEDSDDTVDVTVNQDNTGDSRLRPGSFNLELFTVEDSDRLKVDAALLRLTEGSIDSVSPGAAPSDADLETVDDIADNTKESDEIAEGDHVVFAFEASGVFGVIDAGEFDENFDLFLQETDDPYDSDPLEEGDDYRIVEDAENNRFFVVLNEDVELEAGEDYELRLEPETDGQGNIDSLYFISDEEYKKGSGVIVSTQFSIVERTLEITGDFDKEDRLMVPNSEEATITGHSNAAPGTEIHVNLEGDSLFHSQTAQVQKGGTVEATFDLSEYEAGEELTITMTDDNGPETVQDEVDAILVKGSADAGDHHSVTVHVEDKKGNAVSGADVSAGDQTATTDDKGQAVLKLAHGEYDVTASHDGEEASGKLTVDDETPDEVTLTLGQEDVDLNNQDEKDDQQDDKKDDQQDDKKDNQQDDKKDEKDDDDDNPGAGADEDQPGFGIVVAMLALLAAAGFALRRQ